MVATLTHRTQLWEIKQPFTLSVESQRFSSCSCFSVRKVCVLTSQYCSSAGHGFVPQLKLNNVRLMLLKACVLRVVALHSKKEDQYFTMSSDDGDLENQAELEEKTRLINQVLELQHTLEDLSARVDAVKEENLKLKSENQVLGQYIENLMSASSVFQTTDTKTKRK
ncbi:short coiled-coil protein A-like isoform X1 [Seriola lalandi dorsalis]|nr:short coiled-coil protein A-like isoform X1 [Seriola lalandi dorsalis]